MGFLDKAKQAAEQAAAKAKEGVEDVQAKRELSQAYTELGKRAHELVEKGELAHAELGDAVARVRAALAKSEADGSAESAADESYDASQPPAMPT
jgi:hypothetical protein